MVLNNNLPVLIIAFNRLEITRSLIESLREIAPSQLFYSLDGPKQNNDHDLQLNQQMRDLVSIIDWPCSVETLFSESNFLSCPAGHVCWAGHLY